MEYFRKIKKKCLVCGRPFFVKPSQFKVKGGGKYCSKRCMYNRTKVTKTCLVCEKVFKVSPVRKNTAKYCSCKCQYSHQMKYKLNHVVCVECGKNFTLSPSHVKRNKEVFCSYSCKGKFYGRIKDISGSKNPSWKGGITPQHVLIRTSARYAQWRTSVFKRDNFTCIWCGQHGGHLEADHIKEFSRYPDLVFDINNGRTLCQKCHRKTDNYASKARA
jgi:hypothetical protein